MACTPRDADARATSIADLTAQLAHRPWSLSTDRYVAAMDENTREGMHTDELGVAGRPAIWAQRYGAFDDLACVNLMKVWRPIDPL